MGTTKARMHSNRRSAGACPAPPQPRESAPAWEKLLDARTYPAWLRVPLAVAVFVAALYLARVMLWFVLLGVCVLLPLELYFRRHEQRILRPQLVTDLFHVFVGPVLYAVPTLIVAGVASYFVIPPVAAKIGAQPVWLQGAEAFFFRELIIYWAHRLSHQVPVLWHFHAIHHSSEQLDWLAAQRRHPVDAFYIAACTAVPMAILGFDVQDLALLAALSGLWDMTIHANINWRLKWLDGIWVTQEFHHWHHVKDRRTHDNNYAGAFAVYDRLFGTYYMPPDRRPADYGIPEGVPPNYFGQILQPFFAILGRGSTRPVGQASHID